MQAPKPYSLFKPNKKDKIISYLNNMFLIFGLYFGFHVKSGRTKYILRSIAIFQSLFLYSSGIYIIIKNSHELSAFSLFLIQHLIYSIQFARLKEGSTLYDISQDLRVIDIGLKVWNESYNMDLKLLVSYTLLFVYRISTTFFFGIHGNIVEAIPLVLLLSGLDVSRFVYSFMFYAINCRLKKLGKLLLDENADVITIQFLYKSIVDIAENFKNEYNIIVSIALSLLTIDSLLQKMVHIWNFTKVSSNVVLILTTSVSRKAKLRLRRKRLRANPTSVFLNLHNNLNQLFNGRFCDDGHSLQFTSLSEKYHKHCFISKKNLLQSVIF